MSNRDVVLGFFEYWKSTGIVNHKFLSNDCTFFGLTPSEIWLKNSDPEFPCGSVVLIDEVTSGDNSVLLFEAECPITLLSYRMAWFFLVHDGMISRITEVRQNIPPSIRLASNL